ncbi:unnamed protein product [Diatraea saccharalis]|uniref:Ketoreductase domain-containing protein n=1 Tax=Diatraea saccharalis TaxID=40085 RepID=A0A9N9WG68_9NEOP|nr:unnamed protein product [Diatraea saccharalis]
MSFSGKVVIVTGASSGIGAAVAVMFCKEGASVALVARNEKKLMDVSVKCSLVGGKHIIIKADVSNDEDAKRIISETVTKFGQLDVLVNNAGIIAFGSILEGTILETYDKIMKINLRAIVHLTMLAAPHLVKTKGNIINISSIAGSIVVDSFFSAYCCSKAGLDHFTRSTAAELAASGVRVNAISPGPVVTDIFDNAGFTPDLVSKLQTPLGRVSQSEEIADLILYLASDKANGITGSNIVSDNGCMLHMLK